MMMNGPTAAAAAAAAMAGMPHGAALNSAYAHQSVLSSLSGSPGGGVKSSSFSVKDLLDLPEGVAAAAAAVGGIPTPTSIGGHSNVGGGAVAAAVSPQASSDHDFHIGAMAGQQHQLHHGGAVGGGGGGAVGAGVGSLASTTPAINIPSSGGGVGGAGLHGGASAFDYDAHYRWMQRNDAIAFSCKLCK